MHFTYSLDPNTDLSQGDVLQRNPDLDEIIDEVHPQYKDQKNTHFLVLTQSCDLVRRESKQCKARYVSIAAVRKLSSVYERELGNKKIFSYENLPLIADTKSKTKLDQFLEKLFNNNEPDYFFLAKEPEAGFPSHSCAFLRLSIALKAEAHYQTLLGCRILQLKEPFQAKLGWLVGQLYSRVGTQDWPPKELRKQIKETHSKEAVWIEPRYVRKLTELVEDKVTNHGESSLEDVEIEKLVKQIPKHKEEVLEKMIDIIGSTIIFSKLKSGGHLSEKDLLKLKNALSGDQELTALLR